MAENTAGSYGRDVRQFLRFFLILEYGNHEESHSVSAITDQNYFRLAFAVFISD